MHILYSAWMQHISGSFDQEFGRTGAPARSTSSVSSGPAAFLNPKHKVWQGPRTVFLVCCGDMWNTRLQFNRDLGADLGFVMSMFANRRYMEDLQTNE